MDSRRQPFSFLENIFINLMHWRTFVYTVYPNEQEIATSWSNWKFLSLWLFGISVYYLKYSAVTMCGLKLFGGSRLYIIILALC